ncbi:MULTISPECIES: transporter substrate-binding domain-containing protein [Salinivibrio]|uniref:Transporter substrate-binding domain-containing protein n=1 Tax=Salinivibrio costicola TaxID=51367 RepID=A0ABX6KAS2_SALCS|nr:MULTISPECIES: transporter substrate-binding domain-containing protein [Salinivibrio]OOF19914.1 amino acid ABC transporter substrate-binding protein [Salinivibrio sp. IB574]PCE65524.1 amino acid ABC transporter substrate-binding protein [Salinivibrio sp. YCSC6]QCF37445.1 transporter substrate-binding domain-containing protein [Salinivibrio sp. YCSC6]QIR07621.1 transporter substrate-binding domain-containing protein [Salinivibrio costicola]
MKKIFTVGLLFILMAPGVMARTLTAAQDPWPPFVTTDASMPGISVELLTEAMKTQGYDVEFKIMPWARALDSVSKGTIDLLPATWYTEARTDFLHYSDSYLTNELTFIKRAGDSFQFSDLSGLQGKTIGIIRDYGYGDAFLASDSFDKPEANNLVTNLKKLLANRIDLTLEDRVVALSVMKEEGMDANAFAFTNKALSSKPLHVTSGKANPDGDLFINAYNKGLEAIKANGTFDKIVEKYGIK